KDPDYENRNGITRYLICRVERCGFKSVGSLTNHLRSQHAQEPQQYRRHHNLPPIMAKDALSNKSEALADRTDRKALPDDWRKKPENFRSTGRITRKPTNNMRNEHMRDASDKTRTLRTQYSKQGM